LIKLDSKVRQFLARANLKMGEVKSTFKKEARAAKDEAGVDAAY